MIKFSKDSEHKHKTRTISIRDYGKIYRTTQRRLNRIFFCRTPEIYIRATNKRFVYFSDFKAKTPYEFIKSVTEFIAHQNYSIRIYELKKAMKCHLKRKF